MARPRRYEYDFESKEARKAQQAGRYQAKKKRITKPASSQAGRPTTRSLRKKQQNPAERLNQKENRYQAGREKATKPAINNRAGPRVGPNKKENATYGPPTAQAGESLLIHENKLQGHSAVADVEIDEREGEHNSGGLADLGMLKTFGRSA